LRSTLALMVVLVGLSAYVYFFTEAPDSSLPEAQERVFPALAPEDIQQVNITSESGDSTSLKKDGDTWQIITPVAVSASSSELSNLTSNLSRLELSRVLDESPADLSPYGLAKPRVSIEFKSAEGKPSGHLLVGNKTPTGGTLYAKLADQPRVFLIAAYLDGTLNRSTFDLRDKAVVKFDPAKVDGVDVAFGGQKIQLKKANNEWTMGAPVVARADDSSVDFLVRRVETVQMTSIVTEQAGPADLKKYGLEQPDVTVTLNVGSAQATLTVGGAAGEDGVYVRDLSRSLVMTVDKTFVADLKKEVLEYRRKDAFEFRPLDATRVELTRNGSTTAFEQVKGEGENAESVWRRVSPGAPVDTDQAKMAELLASLIDVRATAFTADTANTGLNTPTLTVFARFAEGKKEERVIFARGDKSAFASRTDQPGAMVVDLAKLDQVTTLLDELAK
jgi:hypothetical protein